MRKFNLQKVIRISMHVAFWTFAWLFFLFYYKRYVEINTYTIIASLINLLIAIPTVYTFNYYLIPRFLLKSKYWQFTLYSFIAMLLFVYLQLLMTVFLILWLLNAERQLFPGMMDVLLLFLNIFFIVFVAVSIKFYKRWTEKEHRAQAVEKEKVEAELQMLKTQINPHFLFNTLNSIYALALKKSDQTAETVLKLSDLLDYILYKIDTPEVPISDEIHIVNNYIELEKIRFADRMDIDFTVDIKNNLVTIPPMLIIPFVENAFKHGVAKSLDKSWIKIALVESDDFIEIEVSNSKKQMEEKESGAGIGMENTLRRLKLIFEDKFVFEKNESRNKFQIKLKLPKKITHD